MDKVFQKFLRSGIELSVVGVECREDNNPYFCTPKGASIFGWAGVDGIHFCFVRGFGSILDPQKTDDQLYVASYGCAASDAAAKEFEWTRNLAAQQGMQMPKVIARHLIQSFAIDEVTPEQAHEIGKQFADEWLKGKYEYVIATHIDKGHCHNHIIFNAVNYVDFHAYRSNRAILRRERRPHRS